MKLEQFHPSNGFFWHSFQFELSLNGYQHLLKLKAWYWKQACECNSTKTRRDLFIFLIWWNLFGRLSSFLGWWSRLFLSRPFLNFFNVFFTFVTAFLRNKTVFNYIFFRLFFGKNLLLLHYYLLMESMDVMNLLQADSTKRDSKSTT